MKWVEIIHKTEYHSEDNEYRYALIKLDTRILLFKTERRNALNHWEKVGSIPYDDPTEGMRELQNNFYKTIMSCPLSAD